MQLWIGALALTRAWNEKWNGMEILVWNMEDTRMEWKTIFPTSIPIPYGSTTTDPNKLIANKLTASNVDWLRRVILNIFLLSAEPSCPNPHFVMKSLR